MECPYCHNQAEYMASKEFYGKDYGSNLWVCKPCDSYVGTHKGSKTPLGTMANRQLRELRKRAHSIVDPIWKKREMTRSQVYKWMQDEMKLSSKETHIGMFNESQCLELINIAKRRRGI